MDKLLATLKALSDETRLKLIDMLLVHDYCVGALAGRLGISEAAVSQHLQVLRKNGLVKGEKRGYWTHYAVERESLRLVGAALQELAAKRGNSCGCQKETSEVCCRKEGGENE